MNIESINPWTGRVEYRYRYMAEAEVAALLSQAASATAAWAERSIAERARYLQNAARVLRERKPEIAALMAAEMGKLRSESLAEIEKSAATCDYYAEHAADYLADLLVATEAHRSYVRYEPLGAVFAVMPWNFPIWQVFRFLAPALMAGNVAILKHAVNVPRTADLIAEVMHVAGLPAGVFSVLHIDNAQAARVIADPVVRAVSLTGSERAGRSVAASAGQHLKKCVLELGGSDAFVVLDDADLDRTVAAAIASRFGNAGQTCIAAKRFVLVDAIAERFLAAFVGAAADLRLGDPLDAESSLAPMARADLADALQTQVEASISAGARIVLGAQHQAGSTRYAATVLDRVVPGMPAYSEEMFGPVASILRARDDADAVRIANDTTFGLGGSVWTGDRERGDRIVRQLQVGAGFVNAIVRSDARMPFGGTKSSGYGRELAAHGIHEFTNIKSVYIA